jgi:hypothetical protein
MGNKISNVMDYINSYLYSTDDIPIRNQYSKIHLRTWYDNDDMIESQYLLSSDKSPK